MRIITLSKKESNQIPIFEQLSRKEIHQKVAAERLDLSIRQTRRKLRRYQKGGAASLAHANRGKPSKRRFNKSKKTMIIDLVKRYYPDFGPTFAAEKLYENHNVSVSTEALRCIMLEAGIWRKKRKRSKHRKWRPPKEFLGQMVQLDGSDHDWFEGRGPKCTLLTFIDDATSSIGWMELVKSESHQSIMSSTKKYLMHNGRPISLYTDRGKTFKVNANNKENEFITQYERALKELNIKLIHAYSPQAKGRVERSFQTHQNRLTRELRLANISSMEEGNKFLQEHYMTKHNSKFARVPKQPLDVHMPVEGYDLDNTLCLKNNRVLTNDFTIRYNNRVFQLIKHQQAVVRPKEKITVLDRLDGVIVLSIRGYNLNFKEITDTIVKYKKRNQDMYQPKTTLKTSIPPAHHPWRRSNSIFYR